MSPFKNKQVIVADMDGTLTPSREEVSDEMLQTIKKLLKHYKFAILGGGTLKLFEKQILNKLMPQLSPDEESNLFILPCSGTKAYTGTFNDAKRYIDYYNFYSEELSPLERIQIKKVIDEFRKKIRKEVT